MSDYQPKFNHSGGDRFTGSEKASSSRKPSLGSRFLRWLGKVVGTALVLVLVIVLLPYGIRYANKYLPDLSRSAVTVSTVLSREMRQSARLETTTLSEEGVTTSTVNAFLMGEVQSVIIGYTYTASVGVDLTKVQIRPVGSRITLLLPPLEILSDSLTPNSIEANDFWYPLTDERRVALLNQAKAERRAALTEELTASEEIWQNTVTTFESVVSGLLDEVNPGITIVVERQSHDE